VPLDIHLKPVETLLFRSDLVAIGTFRCAATHPLFRDSGPCSHHTFVFPRTMTRIRFDDGRTFTGSPRGVAFYNQHQLYSRTKISEIDASDWITIADDALLELMTEHHPRATPERPFAVAEAVCDADAFLAQRRMFDELVILRREDGEEPPADARRARPSGGSLDPLGMTLEETALDIIRRVVAGAYGARTSPPVQPRDRDAVDHVRSLIAAEPALNLSLRSLARDAGLSPFRLCRAFRAHTGETMTEYRHSLRLRLALDRLRDRHIDLTTLAFDLGYSSHSHFTYAFRTRFGMTPSAYRAIA
jgi:AraC-like DNA-binding protein